MLWDDENPANYQTELLPFANTSGYSGHAGDNPENRVPLLGDLVIMNSAGEVRRYYLFGTTGGTDSLLLPFGIVIGAGISPAGYSAFAGQYMNPATQRPRVLVATLGVGSELFMYRIRTTFLAGHYTNPDENIINENPIRIGDPVRLLYHIATGRWGVIKAVPPVNGSVHVHGVVLNYVSRPPRTQTDGLTLNDNLVGLHIRLVQPYTITG
jgi:hypothetical protein